MRLRETEGDDHPKNKHHGSKGTKNRHRFGCPSDSNSPLHFPTSWLSRQCLPLQTPPLSSGIFVDLSNAAPTAVVVIVTAGLRCAPSGRHLRWPDLKLSTARLIKAKQMATLFDPANQLQAGCSTRQRNNCLVGVSIAEQHNQLNNRLDLFTCDPQIES